MRVGDCLNVETVVGSGGEMNWQETADNDSCIVQV